MLARAGKINRGLGVLPPLALVVRWAEENQTMVPKGHEPRLVAPQMFQPLDYRTEDDAGA